MATADDPFRDIAGLGEELRESFALIDSIQTAERLFGTLLVTEGISGHLYLQGEMIAAHEPILVLKTQSTDPNNEHRVTSERFLVAQREEGGIYVLSALKQEHLLTGDGKVVIEALTTNGKGCAGFQCDPFEFSREQPVTLYRVPRLMRLGSSVHILCNQRSIYPQDNMIMPGATPEHQTRLLRRVIDHFIDDVSLDINLAIEQRNRGRGI